MKLSVWAKKQGLSYRTAYRMWRSGKLPVPAEQLATGTILVHEPEVLFTRNNKPVLYARVSSHDQRGDLERQMNRLRDFASAQGLKIEKEVAEIGSGLNGRRKKLLKILRDPTLSPIIVEHRDRLARFGTRLLEAALNASSRELIVANETEFKDDLVQDFIDLATSMCARIYGKRSAKNRAKKAVEAAGK